MASLPYRPSLVLRCLLGSFFLGRWFWSKVNNEAAEMPLQQSTVWKIYWKAAVGVWFVFLIVMAVALQRRPPRPGESSGVAQLRTINTAEVRYLSSHNGSYGNIPDLISAGLLDERFRGSIGGYTFSVSASGTGYTARAVPASRCRGNNRPEPLARRVRRVCRNERVDEKLIPFQHLVGVLVRVL